MEAYAGPSSLEGFDVVVDCALGTGISGEVKEPYLGFIRDVNRSEAFVVSADVPSGFGTATAVEPDATVTFHDVKTGMDCGCGRIVVADIGIPEDAWRKVGPGDMIRYPVPSPASHKGNNGRLMVIGGGPYFGAPAMSAMAALRIGADIVRVFTPESSYREVAAASPVLMATRLPGDRLDDSSVDMLLEESRGYDAVLIGPGLGSSEETAKAVARFIRGCGRPMTIDADAISAVKGLEMKVPAVLTPHAREFSRISEGRTPDETASAMKAVILLKGKDDVVTDGGRTRVNATGTPAMTGAGTGDVLAGATAGLLAKGMDAFDAACLAAYICGKAGEEAFESKSFGLIATDVIDAIPTVLRKGLR